MLTQQLFASKIPRYGGINIYPTEIEEILHQHPHVDEALVFGRDDAEHVQLVSALVVVNVSVYGF